MPKVLFVNEHRSVDVPSGTNLKTLALELGINPHREFFKGVNCGHLGICGVCQVWVAEEAPGAASPRNLRERLAGTRGQRRLACQVDVRGDMQVTTVGGGEDRLSAPRPIAPTPKPTIDPTAARKPIDAAPTAQFIYGHPAAVGTGTRKPVERVVETDPDEQEEEETDEGA